MIMVTVFLPLQFCTKLNSSMFKIERLSVITIILHSIWKEMAFFSRWIQKEILVSFLKFCIWFVYMISDNGILYSIIKIGDVSSYRIAFQFFISNSFNLIYRSFHIFNCRVQTTPKKKKSWSFTNSTMLG